MKRKEKYESPWMERTLVELEDGFCAGSVNINQTNEKIGEIKTHEVNLEFGNEGVADFSSSKWDEN